MSQVEQYLMGALDHAFLVLTNQTRFWKLKHLPSGLFYRPNNGFKGQSEKIPNLSKKGKKYRRLPKFEFFIDDGGFTRDFDPGEWEIVEILEDSKEKK